MTVHVGYYPSMGKFSCYSEDDETLTEFIINRAQNLEVNEMFEEIISKINGKAGCICICLTMSYKNEIRKTFIEEGIKYFKHVEIINLFTAMYLNTVFQTPYTPVNDDVIWIKAEKYVYVWEIKEKKAQFITSGFVNISVDNTLEDIVKNLQLHEGPDVMLYRNESDEIKKKFTSCQLFTYSDLNHDSHGSLIKARIAAGDQNVIHCDAQNFLHFPITYSVKAEQISFSYGHHLPVSSIHKTMDQWRSGVSEIEGVNGIIKCSKYLNFQETNYTLEIDKNEIYSVKIDINQGYNEDNVIDESASKPQKFFIDQTRILTSQYCYIPEKIFRPFNTSVIAIDLGTSRCCAVVSRKNGIITIPLDNNGERLLPSYVAYNEEKPTFGQVAVNRLRQFSKSTIFDSKRIIGRNFSDIEIDSNWGFNVYNENGQVYMEVNGFNGRKKITAIEVAADLLKYIKNKAEEFQGCKLTNVVITVPAAFTVKQRAATIQAARLAGLVRVLFLPEPRAAAFAYFVDRRLTADSTVLVFDLGGGTLDVCICRINTSNGIRFFSNSGDSKLGGRNFDTILINYLKNVLHANHGITITKANKYKLIRESQRIKEDLSSVTSSSLDIDEFDTNKQGIISISRKEFKRLSQSLLNKVKNTIQSALFEASCEASDVIKVLQVGGGSRMPMIKDLLKEIFPKAEHCCEEHPDEVVAIGAAYFANKYFSEK